SELATVMIQYPQLLINIRVQSKAGWDTNEAISAAVSASEAELGNNGRILVRPSGTEPLLRVMAEGPDLAQLEELTGKIADVVKQELGSN
ncbi:MAG: phosphoglucosamine mutase, partial [Negativicutes bacterium]|nr:phosphoglucosamine mutase [Negativicutes bacterium]